MSDFCSLIWINFWSYMTYLTLKKAFPHFWSDFVDFNWRSQDHLTISPLMDGHLRSANRNNTNSKHNWKCLLNNQFMFSSDFNDFNSLYLGTTYRSVKIGSTRKVWLVINLECWKLSYSWKRKRWYVQCITENGDMSSNAFQQLLNRVCCNYSGPFY